MSSKLKPYPTLLVIEKRNLDERIQTLTDDCRTPAYYALAEKDKELLKAQIECMGLYSAVLSKRIARYLGEPDGG